MKNRVLVTGLGNGILGECSPCNYDAYQLICNPSMLLWIDKILIPQKILTIIKSSKNLENKIVQFIIEFYEKANLVESVDTERFFDEPAQDFLEKAVLTDVSNLTRLNPELSSTQEDDHFILSYKNIDYCFPKLLSIYGDLLLSKETNANCLFDPSSIEYCHLKFGLSSPNPINTANVLLGVDRVLSTIIPNIHPYPSFLNEDEDCQSCNKVNKCQQEYFKNLDSALQQYLEWREYDEFYALRDCINKVIYATRIDRNIVTPEDIVNEFNQEKKRINLMMHRHLPKVKKFTDLVTVISAPATIFSALNGGSIPITIGAATLSGVSALTSVISNRLEEKYKWVNFTLND